MKKTITAAVLAGAFTMSATAAYATTPGQTVDPQVQDYVFCDGAEFKLDNRSSLEPVTYTINGQSFMVEAGGWFDAPRIAPQGSGYYIVAGDRVWHFGKAAECAPVGVPLTPLEPAIPSVPVTPVLPDTPDVPETPDVPVDDTPDSPDRTEPSTPMTIPATQEIEAPAPLAAPVAPAYVETGRP